MIRIDPNHVLAKEHLALALAQRDDSRTALATFRAAMRLENDAQRRESAAAEFLRQMARSGRAVEAYRDLARAPEVVEPSLLFRSLAEAIHGDYRQQTQRRLVRLYGQEHPGDPYLDMCRGDIREHDGDHAAADEAFRAGFAKLANRTRERDFVESFLRVRVETMFRLGKINEAFAELEPRNLVFQDLANLCLQHKKFAELDELIDRYLKLEPENFDALCWRISSRIRGGKGEARTGFNRTLAAARTDDRRKSAESWFFIAMVDTGRAVEAYRTAADPKKAFEFLARDLHDSGRIRDIDPLIEAHAAKHPDDPYLALYRARRLVRARDWKKAIEAFETAGKGLDKLPAQSARRESLDAWYKAGLALEACRTVEPFDATFAHLATRAIFDRDWPLVEKLVAEHRTRSPNDPNLEEARARLLIHEKKIGEAAPRFVKFAASRPTARAAAATIVGFEPWQAFFGDAVDADLPIEAYEAAPDKTLAFERMAPMLANAKKTDLYSKLVERHAREPNPSRFLAHHRGVVHRLRGELPAAEADLRKSLAAAKPNDRYMSRPELLRVLVEQGKTVAYFREMDETDPEVVRDLFHQCLQAKRPDQIEALLAIARLDPDKEPRYLDGVELELHWLKKDYEAVLRDFDRNAEMFGRATFFWLKPYRVRALVKLGRFNEALKQLDDVEPEGRVPVLRMLVHATRGEVDRVIELAEQRIRYDYEIDDCYRNEDLGPLLRGERFARFRELFPEKPMRDGVLDLDD